MECQLKRQNGEKLIDISNLNVSDNQDGISFQSQSQNQKQNFDKQQKKSIIKQNNKQTKKQVQIVKQVQNIIKQQKQPFQGKKIKKEQNQYINKEDWEQNQSQDDQQQIKKQKSQNYKNKNILKNKQTKKESQFIIRKGQNFQQEKLDNDKDDDYEQNQDYFQLQKQTQITAIYDQHQINQLTRTYNNDNNNHSISHLNKGFIGEQEPFMVYNHMVQNKILLLLYLLYRNQIYQILPYQRRNKIDLHPANKDKIKIFSNNKQQIKTITMKISQIIRKISIVKLNIKPEQANKMKSSKKLMSALLQKKKIIFKYRNGNQNNYYIGGEGTQSELSSQFKQIRNYRFKYFRVFEYFNTRSYKLILSKIIKNQILLKSFEQWRTIYFELINYIPNPNAKFHKQKQKTLCFLMTVSGHLDNVSPKELQLHLFTFVKNNFFCFTFIIKRGKSLRFPKLNVQNVQFVYLNEKKFNKSYIYVICLKAVFFEKRQAIIEQLQKLNQRNKIYGMRLFKYISPEFQQYIKPNHYKFIPFPQLRPYSHVIVPKLFKEIQQNQNNLAKLLEKGDQQQQSQKINEISEENDRQKVEQKDKKQNKFYSFDWKDYLLGLHKNKNQLILKNVI